jgi:hypothetical protein
VEDVGNVRATVRDLDNYMRWDYPLDELEILYQVDPFEPGDIVRVRGQYANKYSEVEGLNDLEVVTHYTDRTAPTTRVKDNCGEEFTILTERIYLKRPAAAFKAGDRVVIDFDRAKKFGGDGLIEYLRNEGVMVLTEDSGSRYIKTTSHVRYEGRGEKESSNVPTRWLKLYEEPAKRVVGESIKVDDVKEGDTVRSEYAHAGLKVEVSGVVGRVVNYGNGVAYLSTEEGGVIKTSEATLTLLEEAPEPVDENLQRLLDAEVGTIVYGTYEDEYWRKTSKDHWQEIGGRGRLGDTEGVFESLSKIKYGRLEIHKKVNDGGE